MVIHILQFFLTKSKKIFFHPLIKFSIEIDNKYTFLHFARRYAHSWHTSFVVLHPKQ